MEPIVIIGLGMAAFFAAGAVAAFLLTCRLLKKHGWPAEPAEVLALAGALSRRERPAFSLDGFLPVRSEGARRLHSRQYGTKDGLWTVAVECDGDEPVAYQGRLKHRYTSRLDRVSEGWSRPPKLIQPDSAG